MRFIWPRDRTIFLNKKRWVGRGRGGGGGQLAVCIISDFINTTISIGLNFILLSLHCVVNTIPPNQNFGRGPRTLGHWLWQVKSYRGPGLVLKDKFPSVLSCVCCFDTKKVLWIRTKFAANTSGWRYTLRHVNVIKLRKYQR